MEHEEEMDFVEDPASDKHYQWQLSVGNQWLPIDGDDVIETHYCQPGAKGMRINTTHGQVFIEFDKVHTQAVQRVQRLSLLPHGQAEEVGWYFRDDQRWVEYGSKGSSVTSRDIEQQFAQNPRGSFSFTAGPMTYTLDFSSMNQINSSTGMRRNVRRRPKFRSGKSGSSDSDLKWEFMGDEGRWTEYQAHICSYDSAAIESQYQANPQGQLRFRAGRFTYTLDFSRMVQVNDGVGTKRSVRRMTGDAGQQSSGSGFPKWQFQDRVWKEFSKQYCSVNSQDIELQYQQNKSGTMSFTAHNFNYELNFSAMTQKNLSTNTTRPVRRLSQ